MENKKQDTDAVTLEDVNAVAQQLLNRSFGAAVLGPYHSKRSLPRQLKAIAG